MEHSWPKEILLKAHRLNKAGVRSSKTPVKCHHQQTNTQFLYRPDALPVAQPTVLKHWTECTRYIMYLYLFSVLMHLVMCVRDYVVHIFGLASKCRLFCFISRKIQTDRSTGHDPCEDALAALDLVLHGLQNGQWYWILCGWRVVLLVTRLLHTNVIEYLK